MFRKYYNYQSVWSSKLSFILQSLFNIIETSGPRVAELGLDMLGSVAGLPIDLTEHIEELLKGVFVVLDVHYQVICHSHKFALMCFFFLPSEESSC